MGKGDLEREKKLAKQVDKFAERRASFRAVIRNPKCSNSEKIKAMFELSKLPLSSLKCRKRNRCLITGRARSVFSAFKLGRHYLRNLAESGMIPGLYRCS